MIVPDRKRRARRRSVFTTLAAALALACGSALAVAPLRPVNPEPSLVPAPSPTPATNQAPLGGAATGDANQNGSAVTLRNLVPPDWLENQGARAYAGMVETAQANKRLLPDNNAQVRQARDILKKLVPYALKWNDRAKNWDWQISVLRYNQINAICLPGGKLLINTGLLDRLKLNKDETALLISHLMAHALREHARARIGQQQLSELSSNKIPELFDANGIEHLGVEVGPALLAMRYGADDETEADVIGADIASRAGFDSRAGVVLWQKVDWMAKRRQNAFTLAHPVSAKRLADLKKRQKDMLPLYAKAIGKNVNNLPAYRSGASVQRRPVRETRPAVEKEPVREQAATDARKTLSFVERLPHRAAHFFKQHS